LCRFNEIEGNASLQNSLELASENFASLPSYGRKEVLIIFSSLTNSDPGDIFKTISKVMDEQVQVSVISLSAAIYILQHVCRQTKGHFYLAKNKDHLTELLGEFIVPSESDTRHIEEESKEKIDVDSGVEEIETSSKIKIGFPVQQINSTPFVCSCHG